MEWRHEQKTCSDSWQLIAPESAEWAYIKLQQGLSWSKNTASRDGFTDSEIGLDWKNYWEAANAGEKLLPCVWQSRSELGFSAICGFRHPLGCWYISPMDKRELFHYISHSSSGPEDLKEPKLPYVCFKARMNILVPFLTVMLVKGMSAQLLLVPWWFTHLHFISDFAWRGLNLCYGSKSSGWIPFSLRMNSFAGGPRSTFGQTDFHLGPPVSCLDMSDSQHEFGLETLHHFQQSFHWAGRPLLDNHCGLGLGRFAESAGRRPYSPPHPRNHLLGLKFFMIYFFNPSPYLAISLWFPVSQLCLLSLSHSHYLLPILSCFSPYCLQSFRQA